MKKNTVGIVGLLIVLAMTFVGCGGSSGDDPVTPPSTWTVTFNGNTTDAVQGLPATLTGVANGAKITEPDSSPTRAGFIFGGWYKELQTTTAWDFNTDTVTANITLYAKWNALPPSDTPTASVISVQKTTLPQPSVEFTLTSTNTGVWKVYAAATGGAELAHINAAFDAPTLTLTSTATPPNVEPGDYYVSVTEPNKTESARLKLTVIEVPVSDTPIAANATVQKTDPYTPSVEFTLTSTNTGMWKVYHQEIGDEERADIEVTFAAPTLTLESTEGYISGGDYYVSVTEPNKTESGRLKLTIEEPAGFQTVAVKITFAGFPDDPVTVTGDPTVGIAGSITFTADKVGGGSFTSYQWWLDGTKLAETSGSLTLSGGDFSDGEGYYWVTVIAYDNLVPFSKELMFKVE